MGLLEDIRNYAIVLEADDIRKEAADAARAMAGNATAPGNDNVAAGADGNEDVTQTSDIFGLKGDNNQNQNPDEPNPDEEADPNQADDPNAGDNPEDVPPDNPEDDPAADDMDDSEETPDYYDKNKLKENMIYFYNIINNNTAAITELTGRLNDKDDIDLCNRVGNNLRSCAKILYDDLTKKINDLSYEELKRDYVTIKRVFDLCNEMLYKHFGKDSKDFVRLKKRSR